MIKSKSEKKLLKNLTAMTLLGIVAYVCIFDESNPLSRMVGVYDFNAPSSVQPVPGHLVVK